MSEPGISYNNGISEPLSIPTGKTLAVSITPLQSIQSLPGRVYGISASEASPLALTDQISQYLCRDPGQRMSPAYCPTQADLVALESLLRTAALSVDGRLLIGFNAQPVIVDTVQMGGAAIESYTQGSVKPIAAQTIRTAGGWAMAWAGAKAGVAIGGLAGVETGPGLVLTAIGGGLIFGTAGYFGGDWIADWIYED